MPVHAILSPPDVSVSHNSMFERRNETADSQENVELGMCCHGEEGRVRRLNAELLHFDTYLARTYPLHFHVGNSEGLQNRVSHTTAEEAIQVHMKVSLTDYRPLSSVNRSANEHRVA